MARHGTALRVGILRLRCQEPRRYYLALQCLPINGQPATNAGSRTETSEPSRNPDFASGSFLVQLPVSLAKLPSDQPLLRVDLFSAAGPASTGTDGADVARQTGTLVGSGLVGAGGTTLTPDCSTRLLQGQRVTITVALSDEAMVANAAAVATGFGTEVGTRSGLGGLAPYEILLELELLDAENAGELGSIGASTDPVEALIQECLTKQAALEKVSLRMDMTVAQMEVLSWRLENAENNSRNLMEDNTRLQQMLQEEQQVWRIPQLRVLIDSAMLSREELIQRCESVMAAYGRERARNGELVERLKLLHAEQVDALELKKRYQRLQEAHEDQARAYTDLEGHGEKMTQLQGTVKTQEEIIRNLEALLAQTVQKVKPKTQDAMREDNPPVASDPEVRDAEAADGQAAAADLQAQLTTAEQLVQQLQEELAVQQAAAQERTKQMERIEKELEALRQHTVTEFPATSLEKPAVAIAGVPESEGAGASREVGQGSEDQQGADPDTQSREAGTEEVQKLQAEVAQLMEEKTAALLRAEYAEGAAEAAQRELMEVTRKYGREIAVLKTRLAEKDAAMMGGFGGLEAIASRNDPPFPAFSSSPGLTETAASASPSGAGGSSRRILDPSRSPLLVFKSSSEGSGGQERSGLPHAGLNARASVAMRPGSGSQAHVEQGTGSRAMESVVEGPPPMVWMKSRRGRLSSRSSAHEAASADASAVPAAEG